MGHSACQARAAVLPTAVWGAAVVRADHAVVLPGAASEIHGARVVAEQELRFSRRCRPDTSGVENRRGCLTPLISASSNWPSSAAEAQCPGCGAGLPPEWRPCRLSNSRWVHKCPFSSEHGSVLPSSAGAPCRRA